MKQCTGCHRELPASAFHKRKTSKDGLASRCAQCQKDYRQGPGSEVGKRSYAKHSEARRASTRAWQAANRERVAEAKRAWNLQNLYGITVDEYADMFAAQRGLCAICGSDDPGPRRNAMCVDHDHDTGAVRGLLCSPCNAALGVLHNHQLLDAAKTYLEASDGS